MYCHIVNDIVEFNLCYSQFAQLAVKHFSKALLKVVGGRLGSAAMNPT